MPAGAHQVFDRRALRKPSVANLFRLNGVESQKWYVWMGAVKRRVKKYATVVSIRKLCAYLLHECDFSRQMLRIESVKRRSSANIVGSTRSG